ncbi:MAG: twin-arginine translocation signal domain-containing protein [Acidimicrobiales bacterium]|nr:twin-arginine translocation signal domain-containing protein [Acidimicrobiales bacterium]
MTDMAHRLERRSFLKHAAGAGVALAAPARVNLSEADSFGNHCVVARSSWAC